MRSSTVRIALAAILIAVTVVFTLLPRVPIPVTQGYFNLSDVAITFSALAFGPWAGFVAGGLGTGLADLIGGYPQWAVLSLLAHGLEGLIIGVVGYRGGLRRMVIGWFLGSLVMVSLYYLGGAMLLIGDWGVALAEVPINILQAVVGGFVGIPLYYAVRRAYPPIEQMGQETTWREEEIPD